MSARLKNLKRIAKAIRQDVVKISYHGHIGHVGSALSLVDILTVIYFNCAKVYPQKPFHPDRDRIILSKGHACAALYATLYRKGFFGRKELYTYHLNKTHLTGHPELGLPGIDASSGSLGHGLSIGAGMALAAKLDQRKFKVFTLLSDGECDEGSIWEAALSGSHYGLDNLVAIVDYNRIQAFGRTNQVLKLEPFKRKWTSFGWQVVEVDGHDLNQLKSVLVRLPLKSNQPTAIIARTVLGKGVSFMENDLGWHYWNPNDEQFKKALEELK